MNVIFQHSVLSKFTRYPRICVVCSVVEKFYRSQQHHALVPHPCTGSSASSEESCASSTSQMQEVDPKRTQEPTSMAASFSITFMCIRSPHLFQSSLHCRTVSPVILLPVLLSHDLFKPNLS